MLNNFNYFYQQQLKFTNKIWSILIYQVLQKKGLKKLKI